MAFRATRIGDAPIITPGHFTSAGLPRDGNNINGPSLIRRPDWLDGPGRYWLYFAHHGGKYIRLAVADELAGPYTLQPGGTLRLEQTHFPRHIASPDVHVDYANRRIVMFYHGCCRMDPLGRWDQTSCVAFSRDGVNFVSETETLAPSYLRMFRWRDRHYGIAMPGLLFRSADGLTRFEEGPRLIAEDARHFATLVRDDTLHLFYSVKGDCPERIIHRAVALDDDWTRWHPGERTDVLAPERDYEGATAPRVPSQNGAVYEPVFQLRDPAIFEENGSVYLLYAVAGESGIALARLEPSGA